MTAAGLPLNLRLAKASTWKMGAGMGAIYQSVAAPSRRLGA